MLSRGGMCLVGEVFNGGGVFSGSGGVKVGLGTPSLFHLDPGYMDGWGVCVMLSGAWGVYLL